MDTRVIPEVPQRPATTDGMGSVTNPSGRWLALVRIFVGLWFLKSVVTKLSWTLLGGVVPVPTASTRWINFLPTRLADMASGSAVEWYRGFLNDVAVPNSSVFAHLTAFGEVAVGLGLTFGFLTGYASCVGLFIMGNYFLATYGAGNCQQGFHALLMVSMIAFLGARAGRSWGLDGWLRQRFPERYGKVPLT
jgi:thiosulfate dehydrogenase [quinone] large subunit